MPFYDKKKRADPTPRESANWEKLAGAEIERQRKLRQQDNQGQKALQDAAKKRSMDQFRR